MKLNKIYFVLLILILGCQQDPIPPGNYAPTPPEEPELYPAGYGLEIPEGFAFVEGQRGVLPIKVHTPKDTTPKVVVTELPPGAAFNEKEMLVEWTPGFDAANDPKDPNVVTRNYFIKINIRTEEDRTSQITRSMALTVRDSKRAIVVHTPSVTSSLKEGVAFSQLFTIESPDYPQGEFSIVAPQLPMGSFIKKTKPNEFIVEFTPGFSMVGRSDNFTKRLQIPVSVFGPGGTEGSIIIRWDIADTRQKPLVVGPKEVSEGWDAHFVIAAQDANEESQPDISLITPVPFGSLKLDEVRDFEFAPIGKTTRLVQVRWGDVPPSAKDQSVELKFNACVDDGAGGKTLCTPFATKVHFKPTVHASPVVGRTIWPLEEIKRLQVDMNHSFALPINVATGRITSVKVLPESLASEVSWNNGTLFVRPAKAGLKSFTLIAVTDFGSNISESFTFDAFVPPPPPPTPPPSGHRFEVRP